MEKKIIAYSIECRNGLDNDYTLYEDGSVLREYDKHTYEGGYNLTAKYKADELSQDVKERLIKEVKEEDKEVAKKLLGL
ncbi:hypothetical protein WH221_02300 [Chryseobacterium culicis]|uniref:Uncharacterized protein n=1 Tax=Chryseobacterium culicis TaxID=680127 RepID=A0A2S9CX56_CHRCI|nr:hypothetical protein [Chryseobacterium culicis]PRB85108.1 hypothetical protein CQ022_02245 [Chryseobacterium culicis]PRB91168.1 hypothetical protein CQ033_10745 [Chryseobacterium culicis]